MAVYPLLVVFGAGDARSSRRYTQVAERVVAVEPRPEAAKALKDALGAKGSVMPVAVGDGSGEVTLTRYELPEYTSEYRPAGLAVLFPGIKGTSPLSVDRMDAGNLLAEAFDAQTQAAAVIVDVNGAERAVLGSLSRATAFDRVIRLEIRCGIDALYEGAMNVADAEDWLASSGFTKVKIRGVGPVRTVSGERDLEALAEAALVSAQQEAETVRLDRDAARSELDKANEMIAALQVEHGEALNATWADLDAEKAARAEAESSRDVLSSQLEAAEAAKSQAMQDRDAARSELDKANEMIAALQVEHGEALNATWADLDAEKAARAEAESSRDVLSSQLEAAEAAKSQAMQDRDAARSELDKANEMIAALQVEHGEALNAARSDLSLALHSKALAEDDLRDLRIRYAQLLEVKDRQDQLLHRLSHRLGEASRVLASTPEASVFEALTGEPAPTQPKTAAKRSTSKPRASRNKKTGKAAK